MTDNEAYLSNDRAIRELAEMVQREENNMTESEIVDVSRKLAKYGFNLEAPALENSPKRQQQGIERKAMLMRLWTVGLKKTEK